MKTMVVIVGSAVVGLLTLGTAQAQGAKVLKKCPRDAVVSGSVCMDKYEASVWRIPNPLSLNTGLVKKVKAGKATVADLTAAGATRLGISSDDYASCSDNGHNCTNDIYAVSVAGEIPSAHITWFQAQQACKNAGKRLARNAEWQGAVVGTPDSTGTDNGTTDCNTANAMAAVATGSRSTCVSARGAFDMVGNLYEWVAEWVPRSTACTTWTGITTGDDQCLAGAATTGEPGALIRGGHYGGGDLAGPFNIVGLYGPSLANANVGFRCAR